MSWEIILESKMVENLGWTLLNSIWQIGVISLGLFLLLALTRRSSPNLRYALSVSALFLAFLAPVFTFVSRAQESTTRDFAKERSQTQIADARRDPAGGYESSVAVPRSDHSLNTNIQSSFGDLLSLSKYFPEILRIVVGLWLFGVALYSLRLFSGFWRVHKYRTFEIERPADVWVETFDGLCRKLKVHQSVSFLRSNFIETPIVVGVLKPLIIVPAGLFLQVDPRELETIIAHELIHIRRHDQIVNMIQSVIEVVLFYHPCTWWISAQIRHEREFAADAAVLEVFENSRVVYASALANLEEIRQSANDIPPSIVTAANGGNLMLRIRKILQKNTEISNAISAWPAGLAFLLIPAILTGVFLLDTSNFVNARNTTDERKIAIGFVSIPPVDRSVNPPQDSVATARILVDKLQAFKIPAIGFVQGSMISDGEKPYPVRAEIVKMWRDEGFEIGVGGYKHVGFYDTPFDEYTANTEKNLDVLKPILAEKSLTPRYYSYPYLNTGKTDADHQRFEAWLLDHKLRSVKYTIDNNEWMYSYAYDMARNDNDLNLMKEIRLAFIDYMTKMFSHYEAYSQEMFGRDIPQTMVLTPSRLVADSANDLFGMIKKRGYSFVAMDEAQSDGAYKTPESFAGNSGISWFERWTLAQGKKLLEEPQVDNGVQKIWQDKKVVPVANPKKKVS